MARVYAYSRWSTAAQGTKGDSRRRQEEKARQFCAQHGHVLDTTLTLVDDGKSAYSGANLEATAALGQFLELVNRGAIAKGSILAFEQIDRLSRQTFRKALRLLEQIVEAGVLVADLSDGAIYDEEKLNDGLGMLPILLRMMLAHEESKKKAERLRQAHIGKRRALANGATYTAHAPGWIEVTASVAENDRAERRLIPERAAVVRRIVEMTLSGIGKEQIARTLNRENVTPFGRGLKKTQADGWRGQRWHRSYIDRILTSRALIGEHTAHTEETRVGADGKKRTVRVPQVTVADYWPAVIDRDTFERLQQVARAGTLRGRHAGGPMRNLLSNLGRCPLCGGTMTRQHKGKRSRPKLVCARAKQGAGCKFHAVDLQTVEETLRKELPAIIANMPSADDTLQRAVEIAEGAEGALVDRLQDLDELLRRHPSETLAATLRATEAELQTARRELEEAREAAAQAETPILQVRAMNVLKALEGDEKRALNAALRELLTGVTIDYRAGTLALHWRHDGVTEVVYAWPMDALEVAQQEQKKQRRA